MSIRLAGRAAAAGWALAPGFVVTPPAPIDDIPKQQGGTAEAEVARLGEALQQAESDLRTLARTVQVTAGQAEAEIFEAHAEFTADPELATLAQEAIADGASAELAVTQAFATFRELLVGSSSDYLAERATDLDDVRDRVVRILMGRTTGGDSPPVRSVIVARELTPSQTASIPVDVSPAS